MSEKPWSESLDEMLAKLNNGDFVDQSLYEFEKTINDSVLGSQKKTTKRGNVYSTTNYKTVVPHINRTVENAKYSSRYLHIVNCLENIVYDKYPESKKEGYQKAVGYYLEEIKKHQNSLKAFDQQVNVDMATYKNKVRTSNTDDYLRGYYDALLMVKKILNNSKLAKLAELANKVGK
ncbi:MAG: hypothetical protein GX914_00325 [Erysipelotrichia bacterium]|jgi:hypothetical protein|nr:hypothetical protein [Erysipelotrichia bacterium]